jgi:hypothetical protein
MTKNEKKKKQNICTENLKIKVQFGSNYKFAKPRARNN